MSGGMGVNLQRRSERAMASERFKTHDVVEHRKGGFYFIVTDDSRGLVRGEKGRFAPDECALAYRPDAGVMDAFAARNTAELVDAARVQGKYLFMVGRSALIDGAGDRCYDRLSSGTLHPESALRLLERRRESRDEIKVGVPFQKPYEMTAAARDHFAKPEVQRWVRERLTERPDARLLLDIFRLPIAVAPSAAAMGGWSTHEATVDATWNHAIKRGAAYADANGSPLRPETERQEVVGVRGAIGITAHAGEALDIWAADFGVQRKPLAGILEPCPEWPEEQSPNCASCGDVLNERYERVEVVDGQRHHGLCADRVLRLRAERAPKVTADDPYAAHRMSRSEELNRAAMDMLDSGFVSRFSADTAPSEYREKFGAHPWSNDDDI
jgi:hypothetical protein